MTEATQLPLDSDQLRVLLGQPADGWPAQGLTVTGDPKARAEVRYGDELVGWVEQSDRFPDLLVFQAAITIKSDGQPLGVPFPAGFMPPDPVQARDQERRRWLPAGHADRS
jgi:hypothetical protein